MKTREDKYAKVLAELERAEARMRRAFKRWDKARSALHRLDRQYARDLNRRADVDIPGRLDWRKLQ